MLFVSGCGNIMGRRKVVQNYQFVETLEEYENDYEVLAVRQLTDQQPYTIKKVGIKDGANQALYKCLLSEAQLLKAFDHPGIVRFHRMLKTSSHFYLVLGEYQGTPLQELLEHGPRLMTFAQKEAIAKQVCLVLLELQKSSVAHLNLTPEHLLVTSSLSVQLKEFVYGMELPEDGQAEQLPRRVPKSEFVAPEVRRGLGGLEADIFSFGRVLQRLNFAKCKKDGKDHARRREEIEKVVEGMLEKDRELRTTLNDVYQCFFSKLKKVRRMRSLSESTLKTSGLSRASSFSRRSDSVGGGRVYEEVLQRAMQVRNMAWLLVRLFGRVTVGVRLNSELTVVAGLLLLKKSTKLLAGLGKFLHYGKDEVGVGVSPKQLAKFAKTAQHHRLCELVDQEIQKQKEQLDAAVQTVLLKNSALMKRGELARELKEERLDEQYFLRVLREYLEELLRREEALQATAEDNLGELLLLSAVVHFGGVEPFFSLKVLPEQLSLDQQIYFRRAREMPRDEAVAAIRRNLAGEAAPETPTI